MKQKLLVVVQILIVFVLAACSSTQTTVDSGSTASESNSNAPGTYTDISVSELQSMFEEKDFVFVNVHIPFEGDIPNTDLSIPYDQIEDHLDQLPAEKDAKIVLYCRSDRMSNIASQTLVDLGFTNVFNLDGGMVAWEKAGLPLEGK